jgi:hypothetical protein
MTEVDMATGLGYMLGVQPYTVQDLRGSPYEKLAEETVREHNGWTVQKRHHEKGYVYWGSPGDYNPFHRPIVKTPFEKWAEARDKFIAGTEKDINKVLMHVLVGDGDLYDAWVDKEIELEREEDDGLHKHRFSWRRWPAWRWVVAWLHR